MHGKFIKLICFLSNLQWKIPEWGEPNKYVCISQAKVFCDFHVMFIQQTGPVSFLHYQWLRCTQSVKFTFKSFISMQCSRFLWQTTGDSGQNFVFIFILVAAANLLFWVLSLFFFKYWGFLFNPWGHWQWIPSLCEKWRSLDRHSGDGFELNELNCRLSNWVGVKKNVNRIKIVRKQE